MKKITRSVSKLVSFKLDMLDQIETYMEKHNTNFSESVRRIIQWYFDRDQPVPHDSIQDSKPDEVIDIIDDTPKDTPKDPNGGFNWDGINMD